MGYKESKTSTASTELSIHEYTIAGIKIHIHGLEQAASLKLPTLTCLWMLHPRGCTEEFMATISRDILSDYYGESTTHRKAGLVAITFDQRNHGSRGVNPIANSSWMGDPPNPSHAPDLYSIFHGTAQDTSLLMTYLPAYLGDRLENVDVKHYVMGVSLGGHAAWLSIFHEPRILGGVVIIGCANYEKLMQHRIGKYHERTQKRIKRAEATGTTPPEIFPDAVLFPPGFRDILLKYDPAAAVSSDVEAVKNFKDKSILVLSGGDDKLVPHECQKEFIEELKADEYLKGTKFEIEDIVYPGVEHVCTPEMVKLSTEWLKKRIMLDWPDK